MSVINCFCAECETTVVAPVVVLVLFEYSRESFGEAPSIWIPMFFVFAFGDNWQIHVSCVLDTGPHEDDVS